jgi:hypothetical protein
MIGPARIIILALAFVGTALPLGGADPPEPMVKVEALRQISAHVHIISRTTASPWRRISATSSAIAPCW